MGFDFDNFDGVELKRVLLHELLHIYEIYKRITKNVKKDIQWALSNELMKIRVKYINNEFLSDFIYLIYTSLDHEIGARVAETYILLIESRNTDNVFTLFY